MKEQLKTKGDYDVDRKKRSRCVNVIIQLADALYTTNRLDLDQKVHRFIAEILGLLLALTTADYE